MVDSDRCSADITSSCQLLLYTTFFFNSGESNENQQCGNRISHLSVKTKYNRKYDLCYINKLFINLFP